MINDKRNHIKQASSTTATWVFIAVISFLNLINFSHARDLEFGEPLMINGDFTIAAGLAFDATRQRVFVSDAGQHRVYYTDLPFTGSRQIWQEFAWVADRASADALAGPQGLTVDSHGNVYVVDTFHNQVRQFRYNTSSDTYTLDNQFARDTHIQVAGINIHRPRDIAVGPGDQIFLLDSANKRVLLANGPDARRWTVWHANSEWKNPYGLDVDSTGRVFIADTDNHQLVRISADRTETRFGHYGFRNVEFRYPRDVALAADGRMFVADTHNHRIQILNADGSYSRQLAAGRLLDGIDKIHVSASAQVFALDRIANRLVAFLGPSATPPFDAYVRDSVSDDGMEPSAATVQLNSPDILFRYLPDIDLARVNREGLDSYGSDTPIYGREMYVYARVFNRGAFMVPNSNLKLYTLNESGPYNFPENWSTSTFYKVQGDGSAGRRFNTLPVPAIPASDSSSGTRMDGSVVVGPLLWRVPGTTGTNCEGAERLAGRLINVSDPSQDAEGLELLRLNNNIAGLSALTVTADCIPDPDRYEENDSPSAASLVTETWQHLHRRCPRVITRISPGLPYPERSCPGVFENYFRPGNAKSAEDIWTMVIPNLSLHSRRDRDFFDITLPDPGAEEYGNDDIRSTEMRIRYPEPSEKQPMPECGAVQRTEFGLAGLDNTIYVSIGTQLTVTIEPTTGANNSLTPRTVNPAGESLHLYRDDNRIDELWTGRSLQKTIDCPRSSHGITTARISFGEREMERMRELAATGGYQIRLQYITSIDRGVPAWVDELGPGRPRPGLPCGPRIGLPSSGGIAGAGIDFSAAGLIGNFFPNCLPGLDGFFIGDLLHPQSPLIPDCIADGPGCWESFLIRFPTPQQGFEFFIHSQTPLEVQLLGDQKKLIADSELIASPNSAQPFTHLEQTRPLYLQRIFVPQLDAGVYVMRIKGKPGRYRIEFKPPVFFEDNLWQLNNIVEPVDQSLNQLK